MPTLLALPLGLLLPTLSGWLLVKIIEGKASVLFQLERWIVGFVFGVTISLFFVFLLHILSLIKLDLIGIFGTESLLTIALYVWYRRSNGKISQQTVKDKGIVPALRNLHPLTQATLFILLLWTLFKIVLGGYQLLLTPPYYDDTVDNWNFRPKVLFETADIFQAVNEGVSEGIHAYPPTVALLKTSLMHVRGSWSEPLAASPHLLWYITALLLLFYCLRRCTSVPWALCGIYILSSLPLFHIHGISRYAEVFLALHIFLCVSMLYHAASESDGDKAAAWLRLSIIALSLLPLTKNEGFILYLPPLLLLHLIVWKTSNTLNAQHKRRSLIMLISSLTLFTLPFLLFKWTQNLTFANAQSLLDLGIGWQDGVLYALYINSFFEGNWLLAPLYILLLLLYQRKFAFSSPLLIPTAFLFTIIAIQTLLFLFTSISNEAFNQTGLARGLVQIAPVGVLLCTVLLKRTVDPITSRS
jgi:hypothetical protein